MVLNPLGWLETFSFLVLIALLFCACCSHYSELSPNRRRWNSGDICCPNSNAIVVDPTKVTSEGFRSSGGQHHMETWRGQHVRTFPDNITRPPNYFSPVIIEAPSSTNNAASIFGSGNGYAAAPAYSAQLPQQVLTALTVALPSSVPISPTLPSYTEVEQNTPVNIGDDPPPPYPGPPPGESCV